MGTTTFSSVRGALALAFALVLLSLLLHGGVASTHRELQVADVEAELPWYYRANATTTDATADEVTLYGSFWVNETDPVSASIARRMAAVGISYGRARSWLSWRCPRRGKNGTLSGITRRCYVRELRSLEKQARPRPPPPPESPEEEAIRRVVEILRTTTRQVYPWPEVILNPVIKARSYPSPLGGSLYLWLWKLFY